MIPDDDPALRSLLHRAGRRAPPPEALTAAVYQRTRLAWEVQLRRRQAVRRGYALAASLLLTLLMGRLAWNLYPHEVLAESPAGQSILITHSIWHPFAAQGGGALYVGDAVRAGASGAVLRRADGSELRLARDTTLSLPTTGTLQLQRGRLYLHTGDAGRVKKLVVITDFGRVEHLGTQFMVDREPDALLVAVRDGRVAVHYGRDQALELQGGQAAHLDSQGALRRWTLVAFDGIWDWADALAPPLAIDGQPLYGVLERIAQRAGLTLRYDTPVAEAEARKLLLHGAPLELQPRPALDAVLATTSLAGKTDGREIVVSAR
jgi:ferric-dicitrate binding protein FerR (iron transport regulator)